MNTYKETTTGELRVIRELLLVQIEKAEKKLAGLKDKLNKIEKELERR